MVASGSGNEHRTQEIREAHVVFSAAKFTRTKRQRVNCEGLGKVTCWRRVSVSAGNRCDCPDERVPAASSAGIDRQLPAVPCELIR
jgi:hypothetical protein